MARDDIEHVFTIFDSAIASELVTEDDLFTGIVHLGTEDEPASSRRRPNRPAGQRTCDIDHVLLRVSAVDTKRVQLEQLPAVILVETAVPQPG